MKPGRELDALVAEKVMDWKRNGTWLNKGSISIMLPGTIGGPSSWEEWSAVENGAPSLPSYSTDIAAAFGIIDYLVGLEGYNDKPWVVNIETCIGTHIKELGKWTRTWICLFQDSDSDSQRKSISVEASTLPLAICLAALKAVGVDVDDD